MRRPLTVTGGFLLTAGAILFTVGPASGGGGAPAAAPICVTATVSGTNVPGGPYVIGPRCVGTPYGTTCRDDEVGLDPRVLVDLSTCLPRPV